MTTALYVIVSAAVYLFMVGAMSQIILRFPEPEPEDEKDRITETDRVIVCFLWPLTLPLFMGSLVFRPRPKK